ncbi:MAG: Fumarate reductase flavoprotein subunit [Syntrophaceae bacterium PtaU1.Bin231]|nr:MAG: Fumarate reductase flavoprotein subunit [Syntrophaceae bacterium PtaU1.Bin231]
MEKLNSRTVSTDVLVIGAGGAGIRAAIEAHNLGAKVLVVSKGDYPAGCITAIAMGAITAAIDSRDSRDTHYEDTLRGGHHLNNPKLVRLLADLGPERALDVERYGTQFDKMDGKFDYFSYPGHALPRAILAGDRYKGGFFRGIVREATRLGIEVLERVMVVDLLREGGAVCGALALEIDKGSLLVLQAKAVIIATGGAGYLFSLTTNLPGITGDGCALAYEAGARLSDMEFVQMRACMIHPAPMRGTAPPADGGVTIGGRFYNGLCERYMKKYHPEKAEQVTRAEVARCTQKEILEGRSSPHGGVYGDFSGVPREQLAKFKAFMQSCAAANFDPAWQPYEWAPGAHYFMGGIVINERCETGVPGLYAAGEAQSGTMGANRLPGNALTETQVFGAIAGAQAAELARSATAPVPAPQTIAGSVGKVAALWNRDRGVDYREVRREISESLSRYAGVIRTEEGLRKAIGLMDEVGEKRIGSLCVAEARSFRELAGLFETMNIFAVGRLILQAALLRTESRGAHNREDYPETSVAWRKNILFQRREGKAVVVTRSPDEA